MNKQVLYIIICLISVFVSSISQVMLKISAKKHYKNKISEYLNPLVVISYSIFFLTTVVGVIVYKVLPISIGPILDSTGYIYVTLFGVLIFKEKINKKKIISLILIISGILIFTLN